MKVFTHFYYKFWFLKFINEFSTVEKRRRDKINTWIGEISAIVPGLSAEGIKMVSNCKRIRAKF